MTRMRLRLGLAALGASALVGASHAQTFNQPGTGKQLFDGLCTDCHGLNGVGNEAPALNHPLPQDDAALHKIIADGIPNVMPRVRRMTDAEADVLVSYVRELGRGPQTKLTGNAMNGRALYARLDCRTCHAIAGAGGTLGPELTSVGHTRGAGFIRATLIDPAKALPKGTMGILQNGFSEYLPVSVVSKDGSEVRGVRVNEDSFTIQLRDNAGKIYSFRKSDVKNVDKQFGRSMMPSYKDRLKPAEVEDVVAYLVSLGGPK